MTQPSATEPRWFARMGQAWADWDCGDTAAKEKGEGLEEPNHE